ncbi:hypothetical protein ACIREO_32675 [Streptomyces sp. NPDC102441]|uniref:hypothetical protein n=1 Tax=Streptomyces sp. NPDC102441 TaxID=3366176 RepID=UPI003812D93B
MTDHELDVTVAADRSRRWKDERSFAEKTGHPAYWPAEQAVAIRTERERVVRLAESRTCPFDGTWSDFRPPSHWTPPPPPRRPAPVRTVLRPGTLRGLPHRAPDDASAGSHRRTSGSRTARTNASAPVNASTAPGTHGHRRC